MGSKVAERLGMPGDALAGEVAVITGAGRGIGRAAAMLFAGLGAKVVAADLSDSGAGIAETIRAGAGQALFVRTDVSNEEDVLVLARETEKASGAATILINNDIFCPVASVLEMDVPTWDRVMAVNLRGAFLTCRALLPGMIDRRHGTIINLISAGAIPHLSAYAASKLGLAAEDGVALAASPHVLAGGKQGPGKAGMEDPHAGFSTDQTVSAYLEVLPGERAK